ncbi:hypothetical protein [Desulfonatronum thioautotrophicum]|uniref:hypothetical protein n=1 Tax=Desulfonatronum thioautotrophicum TaxID=617001 RepID=UPI00069C709C|nr:hypothetical protein [Desulfonatronum thioautotrophicum]
MFRVLAHILVIFLAVMIGACSDPAHLVGTYESLPQAKQHVVLELQPNGQGTWETDFDVVSFRWKQRGLELWLHTRTGGVITGDIVEGTRLKMDIPGVGVIVLERR